MTVVTECRLKLAGGTARCQQDDQLNPAEQDCQRELSFIRCTKHAHTSVE
jgi:hypothetical protein